MRQLKTHWIGPLSYRSALYKIESGLYLIMAGQDVLFAGGDEHVNVMLNKHMMFSERGQATAQDLIGRELMHYTQRYGERLTVKFAEVKEVKDASTTALIRDQDTLDDLAHLLAFALRPPCNLYGKEAYSGFQPLTLVSSGKHFPVPTKLSAIPEHGRARPERPAPPPLPPSSPESTGGGSSLRESFD